MDRVSKELGEHARRKLVVTLLCDVAFTSGWQAHHNHADARVLHLDTSAISLGSHDWRLLSLEDTESVFAKS